MCGFPRIYELSENKLGSPRFFFLAEVLSDGNSVSDKIGNILKIFGMAILCFVVFLTIYCGFVSVLIYCCSSKRIGRIFASKSEIPENRVEISERRHRERNNQYGNTSCQVFKHTACLLWTRK